MSLVIKPYNEHTSFQGSSASSLSNFCGPFKKFLAAPFPCMQGGDAANLSVFFSPVHLFPRLTVVKPLRIDKPLTGQECLHLFQQSFNFFAGTDRYPDGSRETERFSGTDDITSLKQKLEHFVGIRLEID